MYLTTIRNRRRICPCIAFVPTADAVNAFAAQHSFRKAKTIVLVDLENYLQDTWIAKELLDEAEMIPGVGLILVQNTGWGTQSTVPYLPPPRLNSKHHSL